MDKIINAKSKGHIGYYTRPDNIVCELYKDDNGDLFTAPLSNVIDLDTKNRIGRWLVPPHMAEHTIKSWPLRTTI